MKVSVVIPTHNAGRDAELNIRTLLAQSLPREEFEVIWVNDGSTDDTSDMLDRLAQRHPHFRVIHIPASGWPGRPRNVGIDAAKGEYVQLLDHDDYLGADALRYQYEVAKRNESDIVLGRQVSFRHPPSPVFRQSAERVDITTFPLWNSLKSHKLLRRQFLIEHNIRFDDEPRRLEDAHFMMRAYFAAKTVSIAADYTCYFHRKREHGTNIASQGFEPYGYFSDLADILDIVKDHTDPGTFRNRILHRFYRAEMLGRLRDDRVRRYEPEFLARLFDAQHRLATTRFPQRVRRALPPIQRQVSELLYAGDLEGLKSFSADTAALKGRSRVHRARVVDNALRLDWVAELRTGGRPVSFVTDESGVAIDPGLLGGIHLAGSRSTNARVFMINASTDEKVALAGTGQLTITPNDPTGSTGVAEPGKGVAPANAAPTDSRVRVRVRGSSTIDPRQLSVGRWHLEIHFWVVGLQRKTRVRAVPGRAMFESRAFRAGESASLVTPSVTSKGMFVVVVGDSTRTQRPHAGRALVRRAARRLSAGLRKPLHRMVRRAPPGP